jgi:hypothetical protein
LQVTITTNVICQTTILLLISELVYSRDHSICSFVEIAEDFFAACAANEKVCIVLMDHQQITPWHLPHASSILELFVLNSMTSKLGFSELQLHSNKWFESNGSSFAPAS